MQRSRPIGQAKSVYIEPIAMSYFNYHYYYTYIIYYSKILNPALKETPTFNLNNIIPIIAL